LTGGKDIAGTGTIDGAGVVGPIGGIQQKMFGAKKAGAQYFLAPKENCAEVVGHIPSGLKVFKVTNFTDALNAVEEIGRGADLSALPTCETK
jgi:PDZ domain-containing protein